MPATRAAGSPMARPRFVRQSGGLHRVKSATARPCRNETPAPCGSKRRKLKYQVVSRQSRQAPWRLPHCALTCARVAPSSSPPSCLPGTSVPARGGAAKALAVTETAASAVSAASGMRFAQLLAPCQRDGEAETDRLVRDTLIPVSVEFEDLYEAYAADVRAYCLRRADPSLADDAVAQTFEIAWRRRTELPKKPKAWLLGVARRVLANARRADRRQRGLIDRLAREPSSSRDDGARQAPVLEALARLSEPDREALLLAAWDGLGSREASTVLGCSPTAFRIRLHRARRRLADELGELERRPTAILDHDGALVRAGEVRS